MPDYNCHGIKKSRIKIGDMPGVKIDEHFDKVADLIGEFQVLFSCEIFQ
jgi:hypothetical protein